MAKPNEPKLKSSNPIRLVWIGEILSVADVKTLRCDLGLVHTKIVKHRRNTDHLVRVRTSPQAFPDPWGYSYPPNGLGARGTVMGI